MYHLNYRMNGNDMSFASSTRPNIIETTFNSVMFQLTPNIETDDILIVKLMVNTIIDQGDVVLKEVVDHEWWKLDNVNITHTLDE